MSTPRPAAVLAADLHLGAHIYQERPDLAGDADYGFCQVLDLANRLEVPLLMAGDLTHDRQLTPDTAAYLARALSRAKTTILYVRGDHDVFPQQIDDNEFLSWFDVARALAFAFDSTTRPCVALHDSCLDVGEMLVYGVDYQPNYESFDAALRRVPRRRPPDSVHAVLLTHQKWYEFLGSSADRRMLFSRVRDTGFDLLVTGDLHEFRCFEQNGLRVISPGCTHRRNIGAAGGTCAVLYDDLSVQCVDLKGRTWLEKSLRTKDDVLLFCSSLNAEKVRPVDDDLPEKLHKKVLIVNYLPSLLSLAELTSLVGDDFFFFARSLAPRQFKRTADASVPASSAEDLYRQGLDALELPNPALRALAENLLRRLDNPDQPTKALQAYLDQMHAELLKEPT